ncbi:MAG: UDP-N-acetylglucosamine 2-epimerase (non-hydrolyzing) [Deltaproteobacteria bacterium]|uniref:non-hydrolyzing UDP-N-acetylglucosamine 2-epimerase n=1 Tax=Desulfobacula sp. TaxID=2593537 RepID=UPI0019957B8C|nr:UDP-N-acetylglucosamine 2-epimerase (non-hydrolyzing) [Candidatus Desulfobacula maris]MBL6992763.1 UDP-N-acetylglucosamine 2-epimerase (non-hydrolyzing) [Desulfobacula sp.]
MKNKRILCVVGTRPEAIKMAPVILALQKQEWADVKVLATAQHRQMLDQVLSVFGIALDYDLDIMQSNQGLTELTTRLLVALDKVLEKASPDMVLGQGDTTTVMTTSLACFYRKIAFGHVEAGLRTNDIYNPFPEEMNRVVVSHLSALHFAPTKSARDNLLRENISEGHIYVTGNTVIDALLATARKDFEIGIDLDSAKQLILLTSHRRENFGAPMRDAFTAILELVERNDTIEVLYPVHPNPNVTKPAHEILGVHSRIHLVEPLGYTQFVQAMKQAYLIISDSGGVQEEAPALGKPVLVLREETERPEAVDAGVVRLVGTNKTLIISEAEKLLFDKEYYKSMALGISPYGDGKAADRIVSILKKWLL